MIDKHYIKIYKKKIPHLFSGNVNILQHLVSLLSCDGRSHGRVVCKRVTNLHRPCTLDELLEELVVNGRLDKHAGTVGTHLQ